MDKMTLNGGVTLEMASATQNAQGGLVLNTSTPVGQRMLNYGFNPTILRPYLTDTDPRNGMKLNSAQAFVGSGKNAQPCNNALLRYDEWKTFDNEIAGITRKELVFVGSMVAAGLTYNLADPMSTTILAYQNMSGMSGAKIGMKPTRSDFDNIDFGISQMPIPIIYKDVQLDARELAVSRRGGQPLDTIQHAEAAQCVAEAIEDLNLGQWGSYNFGGAELFGMLNSPTVHTVENITDWNAEGKTNEDRYFDVKAMVQAARNELMASDLVLYISSDLVTYLDEDYKSEDVTTATISLRDRLMKLSGLTAIIEVPRMTANTLALLKKDKKRCRIITGMAPTLVEWSSPDQMQFMMRIMAVMLPNFRQDYNGVGGLWVANPTVDGE